MFQPFWNVLIFLHLIPVRYWASTSLGTMKSTRERKRGESGTGGDGLRRVRASCAFAIFKPLSAVGRGIPIEWQRHPLLSRIAPIFLGLLQKENRSLQESDDSIFSFLESTQSLPSLLKVFYPEGSIFGQDHFWLNGDGTLMVIRSYFGDEVNVPPKRFAVMAWLAPFPPKTVVRFLPRSFPRDHGILESWKRDLRWNYQGSEFSSHEFLLTIASFNLLKDRPHALRFEGPSLRDLRPNKEIFLWPESEAILNEVLLKWNNHIFHSKPYIKSPKNFCASTLTYVYLWGPLFVSRGLAIVLSLLSLHINQEFFLSHQRWDQWPPLRPRGRGDG